MYEIKLNSEFDTEDLSNELKNGINIGDAIYRSETFTSKPSYCVTEFQSNSSYRNYNKLNIFKHNNKYLLILSAYHRYTRKKSYTSLYPRDYIIGVPIISFNETFLTNFVQTHGFKISNCGYIMCMENYYTL